MRFYDEIMKSKEINPQIKEYLKDCIVVDCTNVAEYYFAGNDKEHWEMDDFPNIAPPYPKFWMDFSAPKEIISAEAGITPWGERPDQWGIACAATRIAEKKKLILSYEGKENFMQSLEENMLIYIKVLQNQVSNIYRVLDQREEEIRRQLNKEQFAMALQWKKMMHMYEMGKQGEWEELQVFWNMHPYYSWILDAMLFQKKGRDIIEDGWRWRLFITHEGSIAYDHETNVPLCMSSASGVSHDIIKHLEQEHQMSHSEAMARADIQMAPFLQSGLLAISFMHCKNVKMEDHHPEKQIVRNKGAKRKGEKDYQPVVFKTLDIFPMKEIIQKAGQSAASGEKTKRGLHICRGHFHHYKEGRGMFGRPELIGSFWVPMHIRGSNKEKIVTKDYRINL